METPSCIAPKILARPRLKEKQSKTDAATTHATITATTVATTTAMTIATTVVAIIAAIRSSASTAWSIDGKDSARR